MSQIIRKAQLNDLHALVDFNQKMAWETEQLSLSTETLTSGVAGVLNNPEKGFYMVAEVDKEVAGSLMVTKEWSDWRNASFWWIQSVYILPEFRRQGIYKGLYQMVKKLAEENDNVCGFRLYVEHDNTRAMKTYESLGMNKSHYLMYEE